MLVIKLLGKIARYYLAFFLISINYIVTRGNAIAQVVSDGTLDTKVELTDKKNIITGGQEAGTNLFHSFQEFSPTPDVVTYFNNNSNIENIFTRVTGGIPSLINGTIKTNDASLFLMNPSGIIFGENAQLNINGSFFATTAEEIIFADGTRFNTKVSDVKPLLTVSIPMGLQYGNNPGEIVGNGTNLNSEDPSKQGELIAFLGGKVTLSNVFIEFISQGLEGAKVEIAAVGKGETIGLEKSNGTWNFDYTNITNFENINIGENSLIVNSGQPVDINIQGNNISIKDSFLINSNITDQKGGRISLTATNSILLDRSLLETQSGGLFDNETGLPPSFLVKGDGGDILMDAREIIITNASTITASNFSEGDGGKITIEAQEYLEISGVGIITEEENIEENIPEFKAIPTSVAATVAPPATGLGGAINIETDRLNIKDGARIDSSTTGIGNAGTITIQAKYIEIANIGQVGELDILTGEIMPDTMMIVPSSISVKVDPLETDIISGSGGNVNIETEELNLINGGRIDSSTIGTGDAGTVTINATDSLTISGKNGEFNSGLYASSGSNNNDIPTGISGDLNVNTPQLLLQKEGRISVEAEGNSNAGEIIINTDTIVLLDDSKITASAEAGRGGNIRINTTGLFPFNAVENNQIDASSELGIDGDIKIIAPDIDSKISTKLQEKAPIAIENLIYSGCGLNSDFIANQFGYIGRGGISPSPLTIITEDIVGELGTVEYIQKGTDTASEKEIISLIVPEGKNNESNPNNIVSESKDSNRIEEATTWEINERGNVELVAQSANVSIADFSCPLSESELGSN